MTYTSPVLGRAGSFYNNKSRRSWSNLELEIGRDFLRMKGLKECHLYNFVVFLIHFQPVFHSYTPWKHRVVEKEYCSVILIENVLLIFKFNYYSLKNHSQEVFVSIIKPFRISFSFLTSSFLLTFQWGIEMGRWSEMG